MGLQKGRWWKRRILKLEGIGETEQWRIMPVARLQMSDSRVIAHVDMDCFYVQVEQRKQPRLRGHPTAVVQYNSWKGGGLIAVSYEARKFGVKRSMRGDEAKEICPQIQLVQVPVARGKADLNVYRDAGSEVVSILSRKGRCERASIDEVYLDLTEAAETMLAETPPENLHEISEEATKSHVLGLKMDESNVQHTVKKWLIREDADRREKLLACGAIIVAALRVQVLRETEFTCSAGIAHNKMLAKLASGMNKPAQQTVVPSSSVTKILEPLPIKKMKQLGGKLGTSLQTDFGVNTVGDLLQFSEAKLQEFYGTNTGTWLWNIARGISGDEVQGRLLPKSHGAGKTFPGPRALKSIAAVEKWLNELCEELSERLHSDLEKNKRIAHTLTIHASAFKVNDSDSVKKFPSRSCPLRYGTAKIQEDALNLFQTGLREYLSSYRAKISGSQHDGWRITGLSVLASKIVDIPSGTRSISNYFLNLDQSCTSGEELNDDRLVQNAKTSLTTGYEGSKTCLELQESYDTLQSSDLDENEKELCRHKHILRARYLLDKQETAFSSSECQQGVFTEEILASSCSGAESCFRQSFTGSVKEFTGEKVAHVLKLKDPKTKSSKEKGKSSILKFFQPQNPSPTMNQQRSSTVETKALSSSDDADTQLMVNGSLEVITHQNSLAKSETRTGIGNLNRDELRRIAWIYNIDEIDQAVINELPPEIQEEINAWIRPQKRPRILKKGYNISHYFLPARGK